MMGVVVACASQSADPPTLSPSNMPSVPAPNANPDTADVFADFMRELEAGASCEELFAIRNSADPKSPIISRMNTELSSVGCHSSSSIRRPEKQNVDSGVANDNSFTVNEYRIYRDLIGTPLSVPDEVALRNTSQKFGITPQETLATVDKVQNIIARNGWFRKPEAEIRHASDWQGEFR